MDAFAANTTARWTSRCMVALCCAFGLFVVTLLLLITGYLIIRGTGGLSVEFFTRTATGDPANPGGMLHGILGTLALLAMASAVAVPVGILAGVYLSEYPGESWLTTPVRFVADVLTGVPSIVVGILGYELVVRPMGNMSGLAGAFALGFIMVPIVARTTEEMLRLVPASYREGSIALGASRSQTVLKVVLPAATGSVVTGVVLSLARIAGETAPLLFTVGAATSLPGSPTEPYPSLMGTIYDYIQHPSDSMKNLAWGGIVVLLFMVFVLNLTLRLLAARAAGRR